MSTPSGAQIGRISAVYLLATGVQAAALVLATPLLTRTLEKEDFGSITATISVAQVVGMLCSLGLPLAIARSFYFDHDGESSSSAIVRLGAILAIPIAVAASVPLALVNPGGFADPEDLYASLFILLSAAPLAVLAMGLAHMRVREMAFHFLGATVVAAAGGPLAGLLAAHFTSGSPVAYALGHLALHTLAATLAILWASPRVRASHPGVLKRSLLLGLPAVPHLLAMYLIQVGDRAIIARTRGAADVANYQVGYMIGGGLVVLVLSFNNAWGPEILKNLSRGKLEYVSRSTGALLLMTAAAAIAIGSISPLAAQILAPAGYNLELIAHVSGVVALSAIPLVYYLAATQMILASGSTWKLASVSVTTAAASLLLCWILVVPFGILAAAWVTVGTYSVLAAATWTLAQRNFRFNIRRDQVTASFIALGSVAAIAAAVPPATSQSRFLIAVAAFGVVGVNFRSLLSALNPQGTS